MSQSCFYILKPNVISIRCYANLQKLWCRFFFTTHSPDFLNVGRFNEIFLVRKNATNGTYIRCANPVNFIKDLKTRTGIVSKEAEIMLQYKNAYEETDDTQKANEAFFAKKVILVEGQSESLVLPFLFEKIGFDYIAKGITIVRCGDKNNIDRFYRLYSEFGIPCFVIFDGDKQHQGTSHEAETIKKNKSILSVFNVSMDYPDGVVHDTYLGFEKTLNENLGFETGQKGLKLYKQTRQCITSKEQIPAWVNQVVEKLEMLHDNIPSILKNTVDV